MSQNTNQSHSPAFEPIAVVGVSAIFPGDGETESFWRDILTGRDLVRDIPTTHWKTEDYFDSDPKAVDKVYAKRGAFLSDIAFDALGFGIPPQVLPETDSAQLLSLVAAKRVLDEVSRPGLPPIDKKRTSVILGVTAAQKLAVDMNARIQRPRWAEAMREAGLPEDQIRAICDRISANYVSWKENTFPGLLGNVVAGRVANRFDLGGTNCVTDAACASSFAAMSMAIQELHLRQSDLAITGGVDTFNDPFMYMCFSKTPALSPTGDCRPFSDKADGTILGEGVGFFALKRLADAERDGNTVYAVIRGLGTSSDGRAKSVYAPLPEGQARALRRTYELAGYGPDTVELVEAHGTGTVAGDQAEFEGLKMVFNETGRADRQWCALGTVKSQIGHTKAAAGAAGLYKAVMALHHKILPPTIKVEQPHVKFELASSPFVLNTQARPWIRGASHPRRASVSSFGFGGSNFHLTLEEFRENPKAGHAGVGEKSGPSMGAAGTKIRSLSSELVVLSAEAPEALLLACERAREQESLIGLARSSQKQFAPRARLRLAVVAKDLLTLRESLDLAIERIRQEPQKSFELPNGIFYGVGLSGFSSEQGKIAFIYPGQGSQSLQMGAELVMSWDAARTVWDQAWDHKLHTFVYPQAGWSDAEREAQRARLTETQNAQPAIGLASLALGRVVDAVGLKPDFVAGHSFGELSALHAAGALNTPDFLKAARRRGELMAEAAAAYPGQGSMLAVVATAKRLEAILQQAQIADVAVANRNSPQETVLAGSLERLQVVEKILRELGIPSQLLKVSTAFHSPWVQEACRPYEDFLDTLAWKKPRFPVFSNEGGDLFSDNTDEIRGQLARQIQSPVGFVETIEAMYEAGARTFVEVGPGSILTRLVGQILGEKSHLAVALDQRGREAGTSLWRGFGKLSAAGVALDFSALWGEYVGRIEAIEAGKPNATRGPGILVSGANYGKPKPEPMKTLVQTPLPQTQPFSKQPVLEKQVPEKKVVEKQLMTRDENQSPLSDPALLGAFAEIHRSTAEAHAAYQRSMAESHAAFLRASEETLGRLVGVLGGTSGSVAAASRPAIAQSRPAQYSAPAPRPAAFSSPAPQRPTPALSAPAFVAPTVTAAPLAAAPVQYTQPAPVVAPTAPRAQAPSPGAVVAKPAVSQAAEAASDPVDFKLTLFEVIAEKTGYPAEMLKLEMELEADLGIDSIKRVEILSALKKKVPSLASATAQETASMRSLEQIVSFTEKKSVQPGTQPTLM